MNFFSIEFSLFFVIGLFLYYLFKPNFRNTIILILSALFWSTQSIGTILILVLCLFSDFINFKYLSKNEPSDFFSKKSFYIPYIIFIALFYLFPHKYHWFFYSPIYQDTIYNNLPAGILIISLQSIRNFNLLSQKKISWGEFKFIDWVKLQLFFPSYFMGPITNFDFFMEELNRERRFHINNFINGMKLLFWAILKKLVIVDRLHFFMDTYRSGDFVINHKIDFLFVLVVPFFYYTFLIGAYYNLGKSLCYFLGFNFLRNFDIFTYLTGIGNFWSRWLLTIKQTFDEIFFGKKFGKSYVYFFILILNLIIFSKNMYSILILLPISLFIWIDFFLQENKYFNNFFISYSSKLISFFILSSFWALIATSKFPLISINENINFLNYFNDSDFFIFVLIFLVISLHILRNKIHVTIGKIQKEKEYEDISIVGIVFLGYFVIMFGVF